jgi:hypothetical protein
VVITPGAASGVDAWNEPLDHRLIGSLRQLVSEHERGIDPVFDLSRQGARYRHEWKLGKSDCDKIGSQSGEMNQSLIFEQMDELPSGAFVLKRRHNTEASRQQTIGGRS